MKRPYERELRALVNQIPDPDYRELGVWLIDRLPGSFWKAPASSSGKYHPSDERGPGGTVLHTVRVMVLCKDLADAYNLSADDTSLLLIAGLLHDAYKGGDGDEPIGRTWEFHQFAPRIYLEPVILSKWSTPFLRNLWTYDPRDNDRFKSQLECIWRAVESHEGRWSKLAIARSKEYAGDIGCLLHTADYIASRPHVSVHLPDHILGDIGVVN